jgi:dihydroorotate dehydrogenase electron transfer subunit
VKYCKRAAILENERIAESFYLMKLDVGPMASDCSPGEFVHLRSLTSDWPFLRRPFSIYSTDGEGTIEIVYKVVGKATALMSDAIPGDIFDVMGPLGKPFTLPAGASRVVAVGGGVGIPPLVFFCQRYAGALDDLHLLVGAKTSSEIIVPVSLLVEGVRVTYFTEDGSKGEEGLVTEGLGPALDGLETGGVEIIACGPRLMLAEVARIARENRLRCQVSVEEIMACGVGACLSCAVPSAGGGYFHACKDGPVFDGEAVDWERWTGDES